MSVTMSVNEKKMHKLGELKIGSWGLIARVGGQNSRAPETTRLMEMGLLEGSKIEVLHEAPFGGDPIAVRVRGTLIALRRSEANAIEVFLYE